jgi:hypothetical protein
MTMEDRVRSATRFTAAAVHSVRPLVLPADDEQPRARNWTRQRRWMAPVTAAAAVIAIAVTLVLVRDARNGQPVPATHSGIPQYYVALNDAPPPGRPVPVVVGDTFTGKRLATVNPPPHSSFVGVTGAADDRTFVVATQAWPFSSQWWPVEPRTWYLLRVAPGTDQPARLTRLAIPPTPFGLEVIGMALSPDGTKFAVALEPNESENTGPEHLRIYSVATGALLRTWTGPPSPIGYDWITGTTDNTTLFWLADGHTVAFDYGIGVHAGIRTLDTSRPGNNLLTDSRPAWSEQRFNSCGRPVATSDGKTVVCVDGGSAAFQEYSTATGRLTRTLYQGSRGGGGEVLWASPSGDTLIGWLNPEGDLGSKASSVVGVITHGHLRKLSFPLASGVALPNAVAW